MPSANHSSERARLPLLPRLGVVAASLLAGLAACGALLAALGAPVRVAYAATLNFPGCASTIQGCIDLAADGDTIVVAAGAYTESLTLSKAVSLTGVSSATVLLSAVQDQRVLTVTGASVDSSVIISGMTLAGGHATGGTCPDGCGGAILINTDAQPLLVNLTITGNSADLNGGGVLADFGSPLVLSDVAVLSNTSPGGSGGVLAYDNATVSGSVFQGNKCLSNFSCNGGGLYVGGDLSLTGSQFLSNTTSGQFGGGGAAFVAGVGTLNGALFQDNNCLDCLGGALMIAGNLALTNSQFISNSSAGNGGGLQAGADATLNTDVFQDNQCSGACSGGGLWVMDRLTATNTNFLTNTGISDGGGVWVGGDASLDTAVFQDNHCTGSCAGGGLSVTGNLSATNTQFQDNRSTGSGAGALVSTDTTLQGGVFQGNQCLQSGCMAGGLDTDGRLQISGTQFLSNTSTNLAGGVYAFVGATIVGGLFQNNRCTDVGCGGGGMFVYGDMVLSRTQVLSNTSTGYGGGAVGFSTAEIGASLFQNNQCAPAACLGGGLFAGNTVVTDTRFLNNRGDQGGGLYYRFGVGQLVNDLFAANQAGAFGDAINPNSGELTILHTTIASPTLGSGAAIVLSSGALGVTDTIVSSYTTSISVTAGSVVEDYNLFFGNSTSVAGAQLGGNHNITGDPQFVDPAGHDYHLGSGSLAVDGGTNVGVATDLDGDPRPQGNGYDIGFDESPYAASVDLRVLKSASAGLRQPGQSVSYTLVFSNAGPSTAASVRLSDIVPPNLISVSTTSSGAAVTPVGASHYVWQVANLAPGAGGMVTVTGVLSGGQRGTVFTNTATVVDAYLDTNPANNSSSASVTVANAPPVASGDAYTVAGDTMLTVTAPGVLANDSDENHDALTALLVSGPATGTLNLHADGAFTYAPPAHFIGPVTFTYRANDGLANSNTATVTLTFVEEKIYLPLLLR